MSRYNKHQAGFTLIEILVAVVIIAIGLLGIASLQASAISKSTSSNMRGTAAIAAQSLVAKMRSNKAFWKVAVDDHAINDIFVKINEGDSTYTASGASLTTVAASQSPACDTETCLPGDQAMYDLMNWGENLAKSLNQPEATIGLTPATATSERHITIEIEWFEKDTSAGNSQQDEDRNALYHTVVRL